MTVLCRLKARDGVLRAATPSGVDDEDF